jgi:two-component system, sensor histidine kinase and response regulator
MQEYRLSLFFLNRIFEELPFAMSDQSDIGYTLLAVDDAPTNLSVLVDNLTSRNCRVLTAESARSALNRLDFVIPDLILLDVMMPEMDGFTLCRQLKKHPVYREIPIIFLTAKSDSEDIVEGFLAGGVDYVTKPFRKEELSMRIHTHLELKTARERLREYAYNLEDKNKRLTELLDEKNEFIGVATHDLKNPLSVLSLALDLFRIKTSGKEIPGMDNIVDQMDKTVKRMATLVSKLVEINRLDVGRFEIHLERSRIEPICEEIIGQNRVQAISKGIALHFHSTAGSKLEAMVDPTAFSQILDNLVSNAVKYSPSGTRVECRLEVVPTGTALPDLIMMDRKVRFVVSDEGPGIAHSEQAQVFQKFAKTSNRPTGGESSSGLGMSIARRLAREMKGDLGLISEEGKGCTFYLELPFREE